MNLADVLKITGVRRCMRARTRDEALAEMAVINEYRARGPMTDTLVATVALDDFGAVMLFSVAFATCRLMLGGGAVVG